MSEPVAIVGGGISGLAASYYLSKAGIASRIFEQRPRLGGVICTERVQGCVVEGGPDSFLSVKPWAAELIRDLGLGSEIIGSNDHLRKTYIWKHGRPVALPDGLMFLIPTRILPVVATPLLSWPAKARMGLEWFRKPCSTPPPDRSVAEFIEDHYGAEAVEYLAEPLLSGIYGGSPRDLSVNAVLPRFVELETKFGSLTKGTLASMGRPNSAAAKPIFRTMKQGLGQLVDALAPADYAHDRVEAIERTTSGYRIRTSAAELTAGCVILACPSYEAAALARGIDGRLSELLAGTPYGSSITMALGFARDAFPRPLDGFGFLVPKRERRRLGAGTWVGTKFAHRVPDDRVLLRCFLGGAPDDPVLDDSDETIVAGVLDELRQMFGLRANPLFTRLFRWPKAMAQYAVGHPQRMAELEARLAGIDGLYLAGNGYYGIGIPDCIRMGKQAADKICGCVSS